MQHLSQYSLTDGFTYGRTDVWTDGRIGRTLGRADDRRVDTRSVGGTVGRTDGRTVGRTNGRKRLDVWTVGRTVEWTNTCLTYRQLPSFHADTYSSKAVRKEHVPDDIACLD